MSEQDSLTGFEDVRRAGLNPLADYGGAEARAGAASAIQAAKAEASAQADTAPEQLDLFAFSAAEAQDETPDNETPTRAVLGSRALRGVLTEQYDPDGYKFKTETETNAEGRSKAALEAQKRADQAYLRQQGRGRGSGR